VNGAKSFRKNLTDEAVLKMILRASSERRGFFNARNLRKKEYND